MRLFTPKDACLLATRCLRLRKFFPLFALFCVAQFIAWHVEASPIVPTQQPAIINLNVCRPVYPREAMRRGEQGRVKLRFTVGANGRLVGSSIIKSSGFRELDTEALTALIRCSFKPAYLNDKPVQASFTMEYEWTLDQ